MILSRLPSLFRPVEGKIISFRIAFDSVLQSIDIHLPCCKMLCWLLTDIVALVLLPRRCLPLCNPNVELTTSNY